MVSIQPPRPEEESESVREEREWRWQAAAAAKKQPHSRAGAVISGPHLAVPCVSIEGLRPVSFEFLGVDVPGEGNCLFHAVWQAANLLGLRLPFGVHGVDHVFSLRVLVAMRAASLLRDDKIANTERESPGTIGSLIAQPNQWTRYTGTLPIMAMAHMLERTIVTLSAEGVTSISPYDFEDFVGRPDNNDPIAIYHCQAGRVQEAVPFAARNHYIATVFDTENRTRLRDYVTQSRQVTGRPQVHTFDCTSTPEPFASTEPQCKVKRKPASRDDESTRNVKRRILDDERLLASLEKRARTIQQLTSEELRVLTASQRFAQSPSLALLYFHCCSNDPAAFVHNNESLNGPAAEPTVERLRATLDTPPSSSMVSACQKSAKLRSGAESDLSACASCCEIQQSRGTTLRVHELPPGLRYTTEEEECLKAIPEDIVRDVVQVVTIGGFNYHLNPDLVPDTTSISMCEACAADPRTVPYSIASGHDYGRTATLPALNEVASKCITPVRCFGLELLLGGKHTTGHAICFPSDGPSKCSRVLPSTDTTSLPRVTFLGPKEQWRVKQKKFKCVYELPVDAIYEWLRTLQHTHSSFKNGGIVVEDTQSRRDELAGLEALIEEGITFQDGDAAARHEDRMESERFGTDAASSLEDDMILTGSAVLKPLGDQRASPQSASIIESMLEIITGDDRPVVPVQREGDPVVEWGTNGNMIACAFPHLFLLGGSRLPTGTWNSGFIRHLMKYYDGRLEQSTTLVALLFNQLQRHTAVQRAARVGVSHAATLKRFGALVNSREFLEQLEKAKAEPDTGASRRLNASLLRVLSLVGGSVPFSPFERAATRPKIAAMRYRYGVPQHWVTMAPPEHDDLLLHRIALLRQLKQWNTGSTPCAQGSFQFDDLPELTRSNPRARLRISNMFPALAVSVFESRFESFVEDIMLSHVSSKTRVSRHYGQRPCGPFGRVAAHCSVVEAQVDGRLHSHSLIYGSTFTPALLTRISCNPRLQRTTAKWLDAVCTTHLAPSTYKWLDDRLASEPIRPRAFQVPMPCAHSDLNKFYSAAERRIVTTNIHAHSATCHKGFRGKYMCRLARPTGSHDLVTQPLQIDRLSRGDMAKGVRPEVRGFPLDAPACSVIDSGYNIDQGKLFPERLPGPVIWELHRPSTDVMMVETNRIFGALTMSHTNASVVTGEDAGDVVEQYSQAYMTKDQASLNAAIPVLLSALEHVKAHPSKADDRDTDVRKGKYLASRTVNAFSGANEWSHSVMVFALTGQRSFESSDTFWYIFPHALVNWVIQRAANTDQSPDAEAADDDDEVGENSRSESASDELEALVAMANNDSHESPSRSARDRDGGTRTYKIGKQLVFVSQVESYIHRGNHFSFYSPMEFECIVDVLSPGDENASARGRPTRPSFAFAATHPLYGHYEGFIRMKMHTPVLAGSPPPLWKDSGNSDAERRKAARYVLSTFVPWVGDRPSYAFDENGIIQLFKDWDHSEAPLVNRQRYRYIRNVLQRGRRSNKHESIVTDWRNRSVDLWKDLQNTNADSASTRSTVHDPEMSGIFSSDVDVFRLLQQITAPDASARVHSQSMRTALLSVMDVVAERAGDGMASITNPSEHGMLPKMYNGRLQRVASVLQAMQKNDEPEPATTNSSRSGVFNIREGLEAMDTAGLSTGQIMVVKQVMTGIDEGKQTLTMLHGAGGTGKSFVVRRICDEIEKRGKKVVSTCPTGAGACQLHNGKTFHAAFKCGRSKHPSPHAMELLKLNFDSTLALVVVDEVSMLGVNLLLVLDERLRQLYDGSKPFGGISILLVGDFAQLPVVAGVSLCSTMYCTSTEIPKTLAKSLFQKFKVLFLQRQERARDCQLQQHLLQTLRSLPKTYPKGNRWSKAESRDYRPLNPEVIRAITRPLTSADVEADSKWLDASVILVTSNHDKAILNAAMARLLSRKSRVLLFRWRRRLRTEIEVDATLDLLYNEDERPTLFGYFFKGARGQVLDNSNGNVVWGVANGTLCRYHSIAWDDDAKTQTVLQLTAEAIQHGHDLVDLPFPPDFINVILLDRDGNPVSPATWPPAANLLDARSDTDDDSAPPEAIVVPIGIVASKADAFKVKLPGTRSYDEVTLNFEQHAVDLAIALTVWKAQGATFERVVLHHEVTPKPWSPPWSYERIYVALSRVRAADHLRCLPLSILFDSTKLLGLRPSIFTVKWQMDIGPRGFWRPREPAESQKQ